MTCGWAVEDFLARGRALGGRLGGREPEGARVSYTIPARDLRALKDLARLHGLRPHEVARAVLLGRLHGRRDA